VGLTIYPLDYSRSSGRPTGVFVDGIEGYLHLSEGGARVIVWNLDQHCNFLELILGMPDVHLHEDDLIRVAESLVSRE